MSDYLGEQFGSYHLVKLLGEGGFAQVYLGEHVHLGIHVAVKVLTTKLAEDEVLQFRNEARTMICLRHPNIMRVLDFGIEGRIPFIVMDYAPKESLRKLHSKGICLPLPTIVNYVKQIADALQYVHDQKLIHRDIKPENILLGNNNEVLLSDFGIAAIAHSTGSLYTKDGSGTIYYMSPEQIQGKPRTASDQYALGVVVYEWLSGIRPFTGTYWEVVSQHLSTPPPSLREKVPTIPSIIEQVVMRALAKDPKQRFGSVQAFAKALEMASKKPPLGTTLITYRGHSKGVYAVAWSPSGTRIASGGDDNTVHVWDADTGTHYLTYVGHTARVYSVTWSPDGTYIASAGADETVHVWNAVTGNNLLTYRGHLEQVNAVAWSHHGTHIASASEDETVHIWDAFTGQTLLACQNTEDTRDEYEEETDDGVRDTAWSPDDSRFISASYYRGVQVFNASTGIILCTNPDPANCVAWSPDGKRIVSDGYLYITDEDGSSYGAYPTAKVSDANTGHNLITHYGHGGESIGGFVLAVTWSPNGMYIASSDHVCRVQVWKSATGDTVFTYRGHSDIVQSLAWSPDSTHIVSGSLDETVQIWQAI
jgi:serine/threonine protein kinase